MYENSPGQDRQQGHLDEFCDKLSGRLANLAGLIDQISTENTRILGPIPQAVSTSPEAATGGAGGATERLQAKLPEFDALLARLESELDRIRQI